MTKVVDKRGKMIDLRRASIGKLKAMLVYYEGVVYRNNKDKAHDKEFLISMLPEYYGDILEELTKRGAKPDVKFKFLDNIHSLKSI